MKIERLLFATHVENHEPVTPWEPWFTRMRAGLKPRSNEDASVSPEAEARFFGGLADRTKESLKLHEAAGLWTKDERGEDWSNVTFHCMMEAARVETFAMLLNLPPDLTDDLRQAAILHDFAKKKEVELVRVARERGDSTWGAYEEAGAWAEALMRTHGVSDRVIRIASASGHLGLHDLEALLKRVNGDASQLSEEERAVLAMVYTDLVAVNYDWASPEYETAQGTLENDVDRRIQKNRDAKAYRELHEESKAYFEGRDFSDVMLSTGREVEILLTDLIRQGNKELEGMNPYALPRLIDEGVKVRIRGS